MTSFPVPVHLGHLLKGEAVPLVAADGTIQTLASISPIVSGIASVVNMAVGIERAQQDSSFQSQLLSDLQGIQNQMATIAADLDAVLAELKNIETAIEGLGLNDKLTSIETWGQQVAALDGSSITGLADQATAMMNPTGGATDLLGCMNGLHDALVGNNIGTPLVQLIDAQGFLRIRGRLLQGLNLLAFACAFDTDETYDFDTFLADWSANFAQETAAYWASGKPFVIPKDGSDQQGTVIHACDTIVVEQYSTPSVDGVTLAMTDDGASDQLFTLCTGALGWSIPQGYTSPVLGFPDFPDSQGLIALDLTNNLASSDQTSPLFSECNPFADSNRWGWVDTQVFGGVNASIVEPRTRFVAAARLDPTLTFLGACNGQIASLDASDGLPYISAIHDGATTEASVLVYDAAAGLSTSPVSALTKITPACWVANWVEAGQVQISPLNDAKVFLSIDSSGGWTAAASAVTLQVGPPSPLQPQPMANPTTMPPTTVTLAVASASGTAKTVLFHQL